MVFSHINLYHLHDIHIIFSDKYSIAPPPPPPQKKPPSFEHSTTRNSRIHVHMNCRKSIALKMLFIYFFYFLFFLYSNMLHATTLCMYLCLKQCLNKRMQTASTDTYLRERVWMTGRFLAWLVCTELFTLNTWLCDVCIVLPKVIRRPARKDTNIKILILLFVLQARSMLTDEGSDVTWW